MVEPDRHLTLAAADLAAAIERLAGDLALAEEPARFVAALEDEPAALAPAEAEGHRDS